MVKVCVAGVGVADLHIGKVPDGVVEHANQSGIDLVHNHARTGCGERCRECPGTSSDLNDV